MLAAAISAFAWPAAAPAQSAPGNDAAKPVAIASLLTQPSMNVFRRFAVDRAKVMEFYGDVLGLKPLPAIGMAGGSQMSRFQVGTSEIKLTAVRRRDARTSRAPCATRRACACLRFLSGRSRADGAVRVARPARTGVQDPRGRNPRGDGPRSGQPVGRAASSRLAPRPRRSQSSRSASPFQTWRKAARSTGNSWASRKCSRLNPRCSASPSIRSVTAP